MVKNDYPLIIVKAVKDNGWTTYQISRIREGRYSLIGFAYDETNLEAVVESLVNSEKHIIKVYFIEVTRKRKRRKEDKLKSRLDRRISLIFSKFSRNIYI